MTDKPLEGSQNLHPVERAQSIEDSGSSAEEDCPAVSGDAEEDMIPVWDILYELWESYPKYHALLR